MKYYRILSLVASVLMTTATFAQNAITALDASIREGKKGDLVINYHFVEEDLYAAFQFIITLPEGITLSTDEEDIIKDNSISRHGIVITPQEDKSYTVSGNANPTSTILGTDGTLMTLKLIADPSISVGANLKAGCIKDIRLSTEGGSKVPVDESSFNISIVDNLVTLYDTSTEDPEPIEGVDVIVNRTIKANEWSTICLPFAMDASLVTATFGNDVKLGDFNGCTTKKTGNDITSIEVKFKEATAILANHPYIIRISSQLSDFRVNNVTIVEPNKLTINKNAIYDEDEEIIGYKNHFTGTYKIISPLPENSLFLNGNKFWYSNGNTMKAFRAYFLFNDVLSEKELNSNIALSFDEADGINNVTVGQPAEGIYDIQGRKVHTDENKWDNLKKGVYIKNGKKVVK